ncbi:putative homeobox protein knotted-1-like 13 isoform X2 [Iris pallida]|uniref:Homeobox protein knotted-1-like 13 isoform X2 n=1 Tax=Iris pallida TaxID=29817 RepID=A0AAX6GT85_IRIPA|nr:putative homeobox protein knotted-1-like 13 isoform X2 [Iris pallida]
MAYHNPMDHSGLYPDPHLPGGESHQSVLRSLITSEAASDSKPTADQPPISGAAGAPTWLNSAILRQHAASSGGYSGADGRFLHLQTNSDEVSESIMAAAMGGGEERCKAEILGHPLYEQLLSAHVACLRIATPVDQLPRIDAQLAQSQHVVAKYSVLAGAGGDDKELDQFMTHYVLLLCSFKEQLQQHVRVHAMEAVMACWELEQSLQSLTGVSPRRHRCNHV